MPKSRKKIVAWRSALLIEGREDTKQVGVNLVAHELEVLRLVAKLHLITVDDHQIALVVGNPVLIALVQALQVVQTHRLLILAAAFLDLLHQVGDRRADVDHQVGHLDQRHHQLKQVLVVVEVAVAHVALTMQVGGKDARVLIDGAVLDDVDVALRDLDHLLEALVQEVDLQIE